MRAMIEELLVREEGSLFLEGKKVRDPSYERLEKSPREPITAVDGGSAPILDGASTCILHARIIAVTMNETKVVRRVEGFVSAQASGEDKPKIIVRFHPREGPSEVLLSGLASEFSEHPTLEGAAGLGRKMLEARAVRESDGVVLWDGALSASSPKEKEAVAGVDCLALSKTNGALGSWSVFKEAPRDCWRMRASENTWFARLHPKAQRAFRIDTKTPELIEKLVPWSCDPTFLGYPYPLILADQLARVSHAEAAGMKARLQAAAGRDWEALSQGSSTRDAHEVLDALQF